MIPGLIARALEITKMLSESRAVHQRLADIIARKSSIEDRADEKGYAQRPHEHGELMQAVVGLMLTVHNAKKAGRSNRDDISRRTLQTRDSTDLSRRRLAIDTAASAALEARAF